jgi:hypothetical protein
MIFFLQHQEFLYTVQKGDMNILNHHNKLLQDIKKEHLARLLLANLRNTREIHCHIFQINIFL